VAAIIQNIGNRRIESSAAAPAIYGTPGFMTASITVIRLFSDGYQQIYGGCSVTECCTPDESSSSNGVD